MANEPQVHAINISKSHFGDMESQANARVIEDLGIEGDRYAIKRGMNRAKRQVLLMDKETLEILGLTPGTVRENITTQDMDLYSLTPGQKVRIGAEVELEVTEPLQPLRAHGRDPAGPQGRAGRAPGNADPSRQGWRYRCWGYDLRRWLTGSPSP